MNLAEQYMTAPPIILPKSCQSLTSHLLPLTSWQILPSCQRFVPLMTTFFTFVPSITVLSKASFSSVTLTFSK